MITIKIANKEYKVQEAKTPEELKKGLQNVKELPKDEGMLFYFDPPLTASMWMKDTLIPLDIIFINEDFEATEVHKGKPESDELISVPNTAYVLEVNQDSGIKPGDDLDLDDFVPVMKVLAPDGSTQMELEGGERIFSRKNTRVIIKKAKKADFTKDDKDYRTLGRYMFKCIKILDTREPEYVPSAN